MNRLSAIRTGSAIFACCITATAMFAQHDAGQHDGGRKDCCVSKNPASGTSTLSEPALMDLIAKASTAQDHERLAAHYAAQADQLEKEAAEHEAMAAKYQSNSSNAGLKMPAAKQAINHCESIARDLRAAAIDARQLAADHRDMAKACSACISK